MNEKEKATVGAVADKSKQGKSYRIPSAGASGNLKEFLGVLLLRLAAGQAEPDGWEVFKVLLSAFYERQ